MERSTPVVVSQEFNLPIDEVWAALTEPPKMIQWFFEDIPEFKATVGFETRFNVITPNRDFMHLWKMIEVVGSKKTVYDWSYEGMTGRGLVTFELSDLNGKTQLTLTNTGLESFPKDQPEFTRESCEGGWQYFIKGRLVEFLSKQPALVNQRRSIFIALKLAAVDTHVI